MTRDEALQLLNQHLKQEHLFRHCLATEAIMGALARRLGEDEAKWKLAGLLHDLDFEQTVDTPAEHGRRAAAILHAVHADDEIIGAILAHNAEALGLERTERFHYALAAAETITGLVVATALVYPDKKLASVKPSSIMKRMKKKDFARNVDREIIAECEHLGLSVEEFAALSLEAMQSIADDLGL